MNNLTINILTPENGVAISSLLRGNSPKYQQYFYPFSFDEVEITTILENVKMDKYWGIWEDNILVAFFMLRGFDEGYDIPSYGVCVNEKYSGNGLLKLSLQFVIAWCKLNSVNTLMLKVHPENMVAKKTYEDFGFKSIGIDQKNNNVIFHYTF